MRTTTGKREVFDGSVFANGRRIFCRVCQKRETNVTNPYCAICEAFVEKYIKSEKLIEKDRAKEKTIALVMKELDIDRDQALKALGVKR